MLAEACVACSVSYCEEDEKGQGPPPSAFYQPSIQQAVGETRGAGCCTAVAQKPDSYLLRTPFQRGNC